MKKNTLKIFTLFAVLVVFTPSLITTTKSKEIQSKEGRIFDFKMKTLMKIGQCPSLSTCIVKNNSIAWSKSYGYSNVYSRKKATNNTIYMTSSVTKPITATAILQLYERGLIDLDDDVNDYMPFNFRNPNFPDKNITFRILLSHRAGIYDYCIFDMKGLPYLYSSFPNYNELGNWIKQTLTPTGKYYKPEYWVNITLDEKGYYSNIGYLVLGYLIGEITNSTFKEYVKNNIFEPLEMNDSCFHTYNINQSKKATSYIHRFGIYLPLPDYYHCGFASVAGMKTTVEDLSHFLIANMNKGIYKGTRILNESTVELMHNDIYPADTEHSPLPEMLKKHKERTYGLGWFSCKWFEGTKAQGHAGLSAGTTAFMMMNESTNTGFIALSNQFDLLGFFEIKFFIKMEVFYKIGELLFEKAKELD